MNNIFIISTRSIDSEKGFLNKNVCQLKNIELGSPIFNYFTERLNSYVYWISDSFQEMNNEAKKTFKEYLKPIPISDDADDEFWESLLTQNPNVKEKLLSNSDYRNSFYVYVQNKLSKTLVDGMGWTNYYTTNTTIGKVFALPHLPKKFNRNLDENIEWIEALLAEFSSPNEQIYLILHDEDLAGYHNTPMYLLDSDEIKQLTQRTNVNITVFQHGSSFIDKCLKINDKEEALQDLLQQINELNI